MHDTAIEWSLDKVILMPGRALVLLRFYKNRVQELLEANNRYLERARRAESLLDAGDEEAPRYTTRRMRHEIKAAEGRGRMYEREAKPLPTHRHRKRGSTYHLIGVGKMQTENWCVFGGDSAPSPSVDMAEVAIYRSIEDGSLWVRPIEEFNDGRFEPIAGEGV